MLDARLKRLNTLFIFEMRWVLSILKIAFKAVACVQQVWASLGTCWRTSALSERMERGEGVDSARPAAARPAATIAALTAASSSCAVSACARATDTLFYLIFSACRFLRTCSPRSLGSCSGCLRRACTLAERRP